jgi:hypothetical protein
VVAKKEKRKNPFLFFICGNGPPTLIDCLFFQKILMFLNAPQINSFTSLTNTSHVRKKERKKTSKFLHVISIYLIWLISLLLEKGNRQYIAY